MNFRQGFLDFGPSAPYCLLSRLGCSHTKQVASEFDIGQYWSKDDPMLIPVDCRDARGKSGIDYEGISLIPSTNRVQTRIVGTRSTR